MADLVPYWGDIAFLLGLAAVYAVLTLGLNLEWGYGGMFNAGIAGFWAVGAYVEAIVTSPAVAQTFGYPGHLGYGNLFPGISLGPLGSFPTSMIVGLFAAMAASAGLGFLIAIPTLRLREDYLAIATLGLAQVIVLTIQNLDENGTAGVFGISNIARPFQFYQQPNLTDLAFALFAIAILVVGFFLLERMSRSPWGRVMRAVREDEDAAMSLGKNTFVLKVQAFVLGSALMGLSGALFASFSRVISVPGPFTPALTFLIWVMVMIGGSGNHKGAILGASVITFLFWLTPRIVLWFDLTNVSDKIFFAQYIVIGIILIVLVIVRPMGLLPEPKRVARRPRFLLRRVAPAKEAADDP